ncbi:MAG: caspase family protein [Alphaproteobacteria bacterium]|nr:caspase family protein [Alphaproteobacteria bacterium]
MRFRWAACICLTLLLLFPGNQAWAQKYEGTGTFEALTAPSGGGNERCATAKYDVTAEVSGGEIKLVFKNGNKEIRTITTNLMGGSFETMFCPGAKIVGRRTAQSITFTAIGGGGVSGGATLTRVDPPAATASRAPGDKDLAFWEAIKSSQIPGDYDTYLRLFPQGRFAALAEARSRELGSGQSSVPGLTSAQQSTAPFICDLKATPATHAQAAKTPASRTDSRPKLTVLAIGVSRYQHAPINLGYAAKDACDVGKVFQEQAGRLYREVSVRAVLDDRATRGAVLDGLEWVAQETTPRDVAVVFMAGHGVTESGGDYFFLPHDADLGRLARTSVSQAEIQRGLARITGKALYFFDTCHSGGVMGSRGVPADVSQVVNDLVGAENGMVVFSASTGRQVSVERPEWANGAFTKAMIEGLSGAADYQKDGSVTVNELDLYLSQRVKALTEGRQSPTTAKPQSTQDFPIVIVR